MIQSFRLINKPHDKWIILKWQNITLDKNLLHLILLSFIKFVKRSSICLVAFGKHCWNFIINNWWATWTTQTTWTRTNFLTMINAGVCGTVIVICSTTVIAITIFWMDDVIFWNGEQCCKRFYDLRWFCPCCNRFNGCFLWYCDDTGDIAIVFCVNGWFCWLGNVCCVPHADAWGLATSLFRRLLNNLNSSCVRIFGNWRRRSRLEHCDWKKTKISLKLPSN